ncbi:MAG: PAS domain-containing protein, partial [Candidatus Caldatribacteriaceae bacterium]
MDWNLKEIFDRIDGYVYLIDASTYEVLYVNGTLRKVLGEEIQGRSCFELFQGRNAPCEFCPNERVFASPRKAFSFEFYNPKFQRHFYCMDFALESRGNSRHKLEIAIDITRSKMTRLTLEGVVRLLLSLTHNYFANVEKILRFILEQWEGDEVAYRGRGGQLFTVQKDARVALPKEAWGNIFDASLHRTRWRLKRGESRILILRVDHNSFLGFLKRTRGRSFFPKGAYFVVARLLYLEEERRREELRWFRLFDRGPDPLFLVADDGKIMDSNARASEVLGWNKKSLQNASVELIFGPNVWPVLLERSRETP